MEKIKDISKTVVIQARINSALRNRTDKIFKEVGLNRSEAIKLFLHQVELHHGLPFELKIPNEKLSRVFRDSDSGKNVDKFNSVEELFEDLDI